MERKTRNAMVKRGSGDRETPQDFFEVVDALFGPFEVDAAATKKNRKCEVYIGRKQNALKIKWPKKKKIWLNPPYGGSGDGKMEEWLAKAWEASRRGSTVVVLTFARTETVWFQEWAKHGEVLWIRGRLKFAPYNEVSLIPNCLIIYRPEDEWNVGSSIRSRIFDWRELKERIIRMKKIQQFKQIIWHTML